MKEADKLLQSILRADEKAREMTSSALSEKTATAASLTAEKAALRASYEEETKALIQRMRESERKAADSRLDAIETEKNQKLRRLDELSASRTAAWVEQILASVLRG